MCRTMERFITFNACWASVLGANGGQNYLGDAQTFGHRTSLGLSPVAIKIIIIKTLSNQSRNGHNISFCGRFFFC